MKTSYRAWLQDQKYDPATVETQLYRAKRVEDCYGDLEEQYAKDRMASVIDALRYSMDDKRRNRPNPSKIPLDADVHNNLASYRNAAERYRKFRDAGDETVNTPEDSRNRAGQTGTAGEDSGRQIGLERDMQAALRANIDQLEKGLVIIDDGAERSVNSGFIDITARGASGMTVVIELKAGIGGQRAVAQILSYMGDVASEEESGKVRGILVCSDFDSKAKSAARMVPNLVLRKYSVRFMFSDGHASDKGDV